MTIARRLLVLLTVPLAALVALGVFTAFQLASIEARSRFVADSRIVALATLGNLSRAFAELRVNVRSHMLATTDVERAAARARFDHDEADLSRLMREYADRLVLGDRERRLLGDFQSLSREYIVGAREVMRLIDQGRGPEATGHFDRTIATVGVRLSEVSNEWIAHNQEAAAAAGQESISGIQRFQRRVLLATLAALLITGTLAFLTFRRIVHPIHALEGSVNAIAGGDFARAVPFVQAADETGALARAIDVLKRGAALTDEQRWTKSHVSAITGELHGTTTLAEFGQRLLSSLVPILGGGVASFYVCDEAGERLTRVAGYGLAEHADVPESIRFGEGLVGQCAQERKTVRLTGLPPDYLRVQSSVGQAPPLQATVLPVLSHGVLLGAIELASFRAHSAREQALLDELVPLTAMSLEILARNLRTQELLEQTQRQARQLESQTEALQRSQDQLLAQNEELLAQQEELTQQRERLEASETELREQSERLQRTNFQADTALELTQAGYWHVPLDGSGWYNSSERAAGIFGDIPNADYRYLIADWAEHVREGDEQAARATMDNFTAAVEGRIPAYSAVYAYRRPVDGRVVWIRALGKVVKDGSDRPVDMFGVTQDITEFKRLERELVDARRRAEEATEMKSMFLANMSHEIRTPMNAIIGLSHLALKTALSAKQRDYVGKIHNAGTSLLAVINDILDFSKIEAGKLDLESTDFSIDEVISSVTTLTAQKAHDKGLEFLAHVPRDIPERLVGDPLRLGQILTNFVNNAVKFTERGEIRLTVERLEQTGEKAQLKFSVRDTGIGMTREQAGRLFQPFTQADMSTTRKHGGTGLGLSICRRLVELMGGRIWLESEPGVGTTFYFTAWLGVGESAAGRRVVPERLDRLRALVVDDNPTALEILQEALAPIARAVDVASSGKDAIAAIRRQDAVEPYDIVFMDWRMPGMDGLQASRHIKSDETLNHQPAIVLVTAFGREEVREEAERLQLDGFLVKPVTKSMIVDTLVNVFSEAGEQAAEPDPGEEGRRLSGARVLLAEDNEINQQIAIELLEGAGATVEVARNGREAVDTLARGGSGFDVVLMDLQMPEMDGFQATARIRSDPRFSTLPIVAMTAHATIEERQRCLAAGMNDHVAKPIDPDQLIETVARYGQVRKPATAIEREPVPRQPGPGDAEVNIPAIADLDTGSGVSRVGGNRRLYRSLLRQFVDQQGPAATQMRDALATGDIVLAERIAHSLKGVAGNIGANRVQTAAGDLEKSIRQRASAADLDAQMQNLAAALLPLVSHLSSALESGGEASAPSPASVPADPARSLDAAARLTTLLAEFDPAAATFLEANDSALRALFDADGWPRFQQLVAGYAFGEAEAELARAVKSFAAGRDV
jgi:signal transduction histidine kinase/DNA-binding response OmpR family regulator/HPt (histidine-containing phosphotransfer) domain-containing protein